MSRMLRIWCDVKNTQKAVAFMAPRQTILLSSSRRRSAILLREYSSSFNAVNTCTGRLSAVPLVSSSLLPTVNGCCQQRGVGIRWKHRAKMGQHLKKLDELAHEKTHEEAKKRRAKKKARKGKTEPSKSPSLPEPVIEDDSYEWNDENEDIDYEDGGLLPDPAQVEEHMIKIVNSFKESIKSIRGASPTAELFHDVLVDAYGTANTPLNTVAQVVISTPTLATATCFDPSLAKSVSLAIRNRLDLNPSVEDGGVVKIPLPRVSMESRQQTAATVKKRAESYRQRIRKVRRSALDVVKQGVAGKLEGISKDDAFRVQKEIEAVSNKIISTLNDAAEKKYQSILAV